MRYAPPGMCLNDFALIDAGPYTLLHLQGPWTEDFDATRLETSYGRATSTDLVTWHPQAPAFGIGQPGSFDESAIWTMHPVPHRGGLVMAYTGVSGQKQSIGLAYSGRTDGTGWLRAHETLVVRPDPRWYRTGPGAAWRDPWLAPGAIPGAPWAMLTAAQTAQDPIDRAGCVGLATSDDLQHWDAHPPMLIPGDIHELECPILEPYQGGWLLLASIAPQRHIEAWWADALDQTWQQLGPIAPPGIYAPRLIDGPDGQRLVVHTVPRKTSLSDDGQPCRGMLAQPKLLRATPAGPRLAWWTGLDKYLGPPQETPAMDAVISAQLNGGQQVIHVRKGLTVQLTDTSIAARGPHGQLQAASMASPATHIRILAAGEYIEVYLDDLLALSTSSYATRHQPIATDPTLLIQPLLPAGPPRDDVSAIRPAG